MKRIVVLAAMVALIVPTVGSTAKFTGFLKFPLRCADKNCLFDYYENPYRSGGINSVLDHSMKKNESGAWPFGKPSKKETDGIVAAFNGEKASGKPKKGDEICIAGEILLKACAGCSKSTAMYNASGCGTGYASYDDHPGYDYKAASGVKVYAAAAGKIVDIRGERCYVGNSTDKCSSLGLLGIDHGNGYITQYAHMKEITGKAAGKSVSEGEIIGLVSNVGTKDPHLHFEVYKKVGKIYYLVDPYGWTGSGKDPLYTAGDVAPLKLWK